MPVPVNTIGEPIGKEAATLSSFLGILAHDGILAPLTYHNWKHVPDKNKVVMYHIVKLKFDIATLDELLIMNSLAKKWKRWKSVLKKGAF
ncbi:hypothetical protein PR202_ga19101 [Eleusine coracana subsp. coracana]|uniref:Uncharacterized protein n=1 Tax=Eleusine coracana subsp. coracana TaxID=191504 RepID=A0AAV5CUQ1_ELECO|nr:hypothetical protein PR202_ga19101 [Eleusine coracana subsp. coracana]